MKKLSKMIIVALGLVLLVSSVASAKIALGGITPTPPAKIAIGG